MADYTYGKGDVKLTGGWTKSSLYEDEITFFDESGFSSMLFERTVDGKTEYAYVYAGTDPKSIDDWENNIAQFFGMSDQYETAINNAEFLHKQLGKALTFVGHSLGGGLAAASAYATGGHAITFNAAGVSDATVVKNPSAVIDAYVNVRDELNIIQQRYNLPTADGNINWRYGNASVLGHSIKNFYKPSFGTKIYNNLESTYMKFINSVKQVFNPLKYF